MTVVYIAGSGRSGSTLIDRLLGQLPDVVSCGELAHLWTRGFANRESCGCGKPLPECSLWSQIGQDLISNGRSLADIVNLQRRVGRFRHIPLLVTGQGPHEFQRNLQRYASIVRQLYAAIKAHTGARIVVDSSKTVEHLLIAANTPQLDIRVVHVVRNPRAVAYSWLRRRLRPEVTRTPTWMPRYNPGRIAAQWQLLNGTLEAARPRRLPYLRIRYEDLIERPNEQLANLVKFAGAPAPVRPLVRNGRADLLESHTVSGNPMRFQHGSVHLTLDNAWVHALDPARRKVVEAATWPLRKRYGY